MQTNAIVWQMIEGRRQGEDVGKLAYIFHQLLAMEICAACENVRTQKKCNQVALSGGVFQNRLLLELVEKELLNRKFQVLRHHLIPPNDGGIGLGQAVYGMAYLNKKKQTECKKCKVKNRILKSIKRIDYGRLRAMCVGLSAKVVRINEGMAVVDARWSKEGGFCGTSG